MKLALNFLDMCRVYFDLQQLHELHPKEIERDNDYL